MLLRFSCKTIKTRWTHRLWFGDEDAVWGRTAEKHEATSSFSVFMLNLANVKRTLTMSAETETASEPSQLLSVTSLRSQLLHRWKRTTQERESTPPRQIFHHRRRRRSQWSCPDWKREQIKGRGSPAGDHRHSNAAQTIKVKHCTKTWKMTEMQPIWWSVQMLEDSFKYEVRVQTWGSLHGYISADDFLQPVRTPTVSVWVVPAHTLKSVIDNIRILKVSFVSDTPPLGLLSTLKVALRGRKVGDPWSEEVPTNLSTPLCFHFLFHLHALQNNHDLCARTSLCVCVCARKWKTAVSCVQAHEAVCVCDQGVSSMPERSAPWSLDQLISVQQLLRDGGSSSHRARRARHHRQQGELLHVCHTSLYLHEGHAPTHTPDPPSSHDRTNELLMFPMSRRVWLECFWCRHTWTRDRVWRPERLSPWNLFFWINCKNEAVFFYFIKYEQKNLQLVTNLLFITA